MAGHGLRDVSILSASGSGIIESDGTNGAIATGYFEEFPKPTGSITSDA